MGNRSLERHLSYASTYTHHPT